MSKNKVKIIQERTFAGLKNFNFL